MNAAVITGVHGAWLLQGIVGMGLAIALALRSGLVSLVLLFFFERIQAIPSPQPDAKQNGQQKNEKFQRLRPKMTSSTNRVPA